MRERFNHLGNLAGASLIIMGIVFANEREPIWNREPTFYIANALPPFLAMVLSMCIASTPCIALHRPERVAVTIECLYQNTGIGASIAFSVFEGREASRAAGTPLYYGVPRTRGSSHPQLCTHDSSRC